MTFYSLFNARQGHSTVGKKAQCKGEMKAKGCERSVKFLENLIEIFLWPCQKKVDT